MAQSSIPRYRTVAAWMPCIFVVIPANYRKGVMGVGGGGGLTGDNRKETSYTLGTYQKKNTVF